MSLLRFHRWGNRGLLCFCSLSKGPESVCGGGGALLWSFIPSVFIPISFPVEILYILCTGEILKWEFQFRGDTQRWVQRSGSHSAGPEAVPGSPRLHTGTRHESASGSWHVRALATLCSVRWNSPKSLLNRGFWNHLFQSIVTSGVISFI